jgi:hypothetical protein
VFKARIEAGETFDDPGKVLKTVAAEVAKGTITYPEARGIATIYQKAQALNLAEKQLPKFGITPPSPADIGYKVVTKLEFTPGILGGDIKVDFTDPKSIDRAFNKLLVDQKLKSMFIADPAAMKETIRANTYQGDGTPSIYGR